ncbi:MAG: succinate dehydrogenase cytochrome b subunit [Muribaculaceae bacterium]|nr:succinate dehydrogenase cytochrome b subunit [Muribaculaceae bacterium]
MWLSSSSVGRKFVMAITGAALVLFVTFHCLMNAVAICWPAAYNSICEFLGANWYALIASAGLAALIIIHIIYAVVLTLQNRKARGNDRYSISKRPKNVEWSSQNMLVLGIVILAFLVVHMIQFWAKMQLQEIRGVEEALPPAAGTLFIQEAFQLVWTPIVYIIGFIALWFHMNHGFWSMFQSCGWTNTAWIERLKKIGCWWVSIVVCCFIAQAIVFTVKAHQHYYINNEDLRAQYVEMVGEMCMKDFGPDAAQIVNQISSMPYSVVSEQIPQAVQQMNAQLENPGFAGQMESNPEMKKQFETQLKLFKSYKVLFDYLSAQPVVEEVVEIEANPNPAN